MTDTKRKADYVIEVKLPETEEVDHHDNRSNTSTASHTTAERDQWKRRFDFLMACVGLSVGLGNVWRFPYLCYKNGGGAFLIPYFTAVFAAGIPVFILEVTLGQMTNQGGIAAWNICPLFRGIGFASMVTNFSLDCYYNVILAWALYFLFSSFTNPLPWTLCGQWWNTDRCRNWLTSPTNQSTINTTVVMSALSDRFIDPATEFWERQVLGLSDGIEHMGTINWKLALCLLLAWIIVFLCIFNGIKTSGKIMYFTATAPYLFMFILLGRSVTLEGASVGLRYYLTPEWEKLKSLSIWVDAGSQIFFSYSISLGTLTALGSYNPYIHKSIRDCLMYASVNTFTSLLAGFIVFATLGHMATLANVSMDQVADSGPGLAFVVYPKALGVMPFSPFWAICFFLMILLLGIDSQFAGVEGFITSIADFYPRLMSNRRWRALFVGSICTVMFLFGLPMVTEGGMYLFQLLNNYSGGLIILVTAFFECIVVGYFYGAKKMRQHMTRMNGFSVGHFPAVFWCVISPIFILVVFTISGVIYTDLTYERAEKTIIYQYPSWAMKLGWLLASCSPIMIPIVMIIQIIRTPGTLVQRIRHLYQPRFTEKQLNNLYPKDLPLADFTVSEPRDFPDQNHTISVNDGRQDHKQRALNNSTKL